MTFKQVYKNEQLRIFNLLLPKGELLPDHKTATEAFLIVIKGKAQISFSDRKEELFDGKALVIPANDTHNVEAYDDFIAYLIMGSGKMRD